VNQEERGRVQRDVEDAFGRLDERNRERLLRMAQHLAQHKVLSLLYLGADNSEPYCLCTDLN
jgi:hypothetical protein